MHAIEWRPVPIPEFADFYEVSNDGRVRGRHAHPNSGREMKLAMTRKGYLLAQMCRVRPTLSRGVSVHLLVLGAFVGPRPEGCETNHKNGDKQDNRLRNLEYVTQRENMAHAVTHGLKARGERAGSAKLTEADVRTILVTHGTHVALGRQYGVSYQTIRAIRFGLTWRHVSGFSPQSASPPAAAALPQS